MIILGSIRYCMTVPVVFIMTGLYGYVISIPKCDTYLQNHNFLMEFPKMDTRYSKEIDRLCLQVYSISESSRGRQTTDCWYGCKKPFLNSRSCPEFHHPQLVCLCAPRSQASQHGKMRSFYGTSFETKTKLTPNRTENGLVSARRKKHKTVKKVPQIPEKSSICGFLV